MLDIESQEDRAPVVIDDPRFGMSERMWNILDSDTNKRELYEPKIIPKRGGGRRELLVPCEELRDAQRRMLYELIYPCSGPSDQAHGFVRKRSPATAAAHHLDKDVVLCMDVKDFFPSITEEMVKERVGIWTFDPLKKDFLDTVVKVCMFEGKLPQGAPTSPAISNIVCRPLDFILSEASVHMMLSFTRYADDFVWSARDECIGPIRDGKPAWKCEHYMKKLTTVGEHGRCDGCRMQGPKLNKIIPWATKQIEEFGFKVNTAKTTLVRRGDHAKAQRVNGLVVNEGADYPRVGRAYRKNTKAMLRSLVSRKVWGDKARRQEGLVDIRRLMSRVSFIQSAHKPHADRLWSMVDHYRILCEQEHPFYQEVMDWYHGGCLGGWEAGKRYVYDRAS